MTIIKNHFDYLYFTECKFENPLFPSLRLSGTIKEIPKKVRVFTRNNRLVIGEKQLVLPLNGKDCLIIPTEKLGILPGHPLNNTNQTIFIQECKLIFNGFKSLKMELQPYITNPFRRLRISRFSSQENKVFLNPNPRRKKTLYFQWSKNEITKPPVLFELEGVYKNPLAWVDLAIESVSFELEVPYDIQVTQPNMVGIL